jgi:hypothetical protein
LRRETEPEAPDRVIPEIAPAPAVELDLAPVLDEEPDDLDAAQARFRRIARLGALDPDDGLDL